MNLFSPPPLPPKEKGAPRPAPPPRVGFRVVDDLVDAAFWIARVTFAWAAAVDGYFSNFRLVYSRWVTHRGLDDVARRIEQMRQSGGCSCPECQKRYRQELAAREQLEAGVRDAVRDALQAQAMQDAANTASRRGSN